MAKASTTAVAVQVLIIDVAPVRQDKDGMVSLTDLYQMAEGQGWTEGKVDPRTWTSRNGKELIDFATLSYNVTKHHIIKTARGKGGGTYAHKNVALAYAKYLSPELHMQVNDVYLRAASGDVTLAEQIFDKANLADQQKHAERVNGKVARKLLVGTLSNHGVNGRGYADCTNALYLPTIGMTAAAAKEQRGLKVSANLRDNMDMEELARVSLAEIIARKNIEQKNMQGNPTCQSECYRAGMAVANVR